MKEFTTFRMRRISKLPDGKSLEGTEKNCKINRRTRHMTSRKSEAKYFENVVRLQTANYSVL